MVPVRYFVVKCGREWRVECDSAYKNGFQSKKEAVRHAIEAARRKIRDGKPCEVLVQDEDKLWYTAWTSQAGEA